MQIGRQRLDLAMGVDEVVAHVARVRGRIAHAADPGHGRSRADQASKPDCAAMTVEPVIGVDVLSDERDLAHASCGKARDLVEDCAERARSLRAARIGHDAKRAELVAPLLHGHERGYAAPGDRVGRRRRKMRKLVLGREVGGDDAGPIARFAQELRQTIKDS